MKNIKISTTLQENEFNLSTPELSPLKKQSKQIIKGKRLSVPEEMDKKLEIAKRLSGMNKDEQLLSLLCDVDRELKIRR